MNLNENIERILVSKEEIAKRTAELGDRISRDYKGKRPLLVCVLKGSVMFFSDLVRRITEDVELDFMAISSYGSGSTSSGEVRVLKDLGVKVEGRDLLVIEDIVDSLSTWVLPYQTNLWWATVSTTTSVTAICPTFACSIQKHTVERRFFKS